MAFDCQINQKTFKDDELYNNPAWELMCRHKRIQDYLIAKYIVYSLINITNETDMNHLKFTYPYSINSFCKLLINKDISTQNKIFDGALKLLANPYDVKTHANAIYLIGRLSNDRLKNEAIKVINEYLENNSNIDNLSINTDNEKLLALRTSYISLAYLGDTKASNEYLKKLLSYENWCSINRGFHLIYYGDKEFDSKYALLAQDNDLDFPNTELHLNERIKDIDRNAIVDIEIYTLFSLIHHRHKNGCYNNEEKRKKAQDLIDFIFRYKKTENHRIIFYLQILQQDLNHPVYSHFSLLNKLFEIKFIKRSGWEKRKFKNVESVASHTLGTIYIASFLLPSISDEYKDKGYNKSNIIEMLTYHDLAEIEIGDLLPEEKTVISIKKENDFYSKLAAYSAYGFSNVLTIENLWNEYNAKIENNINALIAYEIDKLEAYAQLLFYLRKGETISQKDFEDWLDTISIVKTKHGIDIRKWIEQEFMDVISKYQR